jgi:hypothetical protein
MNEGPVPGAPTREQPCHIALGHGIVAYAPIGMIDRLLQVDQQQDSSVRRLWRGAYVAAWPNEANMGGGEAGSTGCGLEAAPF